MINSPEKRNLEFGRLLITFYPRAVDELVIVCASAGKNGLGEPIEEFKNSLQKFSLSMLFFIDRGASWYNQPEIHMALEKIKEIASDYRNVAILGESMGGSGSILLTNVVPHAERVLALAPQYSICQPFINFDDRYLDYAVRYPIQQFWSFEQTPISHRVRILIGTKEWRDQVHAGMFAAEGIKVSVVKGASHSVAADLKSSIPGRNVLADLLAKFLDFKTPFDDAEIASALSPLYSSYCTKGLFWRLKEAELGRSYGEVARKRYVLPPPEGCENIALGSETSQSSLSAWSKGASVSEESARAITLLPTGGYSFHTKKENQPWWSADFGRLRSLRQVRIYNRLDNAAAQSRGVRLVIECASHPGDWIELFKKEDFDIFGGIDGTPLIWTPSQPALTRFLRIRLLDYTWLHYDAIQIFGC